jgi:DNA-binding NtrC family response regulator
MARTKRQKATRTRSKASSRKTSTRTRKSGAARGGDNAATLESEVTELVSKLLNARRPVSLRDARRQFERSYVEYIIRKYDGDRQKASEKLDIGFSTLKEKIRKS